MSQRAFWDTDLRTLDFNRYDKFVIIRVFERGNEADKEQIINFYGKKKITDVLTRASSLIPLAVESAKQLLDLRDEKFACYKGKQPTRNFSRY